MKKTITEICNHLFSTGRLVLLLLAFSFSFSTVFSQTPQAFNYQAVARDATGHLLTTQLIGVKLVVHRFSASGSISYSETQSTTTNAFGLFTLQVGYGTPVAGELDTIVWSKSTYWLQVEMDPTGGTTYTDMGTSQLLSVPYAMYAASAGSMAETDPIWTAASVNYYTKTDMQTSGSAQLHFNNITNKPTTLVGYGITDAQPLITAGTTAQYWRGDESWQTLNNAAVGLGLVENTALSTWAGSTNLTTLGTITTGIWNAGTVTSSGAITGATIVKTGGTSSQFLKADGSIDATAYLTPSWIGSTNVTTLGTITTGTWNAGAVTSSGAVTGSTIVKTGGTSSQFLKADGSIDANAYLTTIREVADEFTATASQTSFTLTQTPGVNSKIKMYVNGVRISNTAYSHVGTALTYNPTNNGTYTLTAGDRIQFDYYY